MAAAAGTPVVFVHGLWLHADSWSPWMDLFKEQGYAPSAPGWPGDSATVEETRKNADKVAGHGINNVVDHYVKAIAAPGAHQGHRLPAAVRPAGRVRRAQEPRQSEQGGFPHEGAVPLRLRERHLRGGVERALRPLDDPLARQAALRGRVRQLLAWLAGQGRHEERRARTSARHRGWTRSHGAGGDLQGNAQALSPLAGGDRLPGVPGSRPLAHHRQGLARGCRHRPRLVEGPRALALERSGQRGQPLPRPALVDESALTRRGAGGLAERRFGLASVAG